jgi:hypothetical protein
MAMQLSLSVHAAGNRQLQQMMIISSVLNFEQSDQLKIAYRRYQWTRNISLDCSQCFLQRFDQCLVPKNANSEHEEAQCNSFIGSVIFLGLVTALRLPVSATRKCFEMMICKRRRSHCKSNDSTDRGMKKWFPGMLPKALQT